MTISSTNLILFLAGFSQLVQVTLIGNLFGTDLFLTATIPFLVRSRYRFLLPRYTWFILILIAFWFFCAVLTDIYRETQFANYARGWSKIVLFATSLLALLLLTRYDIGKLVYFFVGVGFSDIIQTYAFPNGHMLLDPWKFGYSQGLTPLVAILASTAPFSRMFGLTGAAIALFSIAAVNMAFDFRSMFGIAAAAGFFCLLKGAIDARPIWRARFSPLAFSAVLLGGFFAAQGIIAIYAGAAGAGLLGLEAKEKYLWQSSSDLSLMQSGRVESLVSTKAIADSPILGHGSWAEDVRYVALLADILESKGIQVSAEIYDTTLIPSHSFLLGSWVEAGLLGGMFWIAVMVIAPIALYRAFKADARYFPVAVFFIIFLCWDVLFSPFGADQRFFTAARICLVLSLVQAGGKTELRGTRLA